MKRILKWTIYLLIFGVILIFSIDFWVKSFASDKCFSNVSELKSSKVGLLLGTSKHLGNGSENLYYSYRIDAAVELFKAGKIKFILISGDNGSASYNEPQMMKDDLVKRGIPANKIVLDFAGFRTLDSVLRCEKVFGEKDVIVISQKFHNERAIFIADSYKIKMQGFNAKDVNKYYGFKTNIREKFARFNMLLDLIFGKDPKFLGEKIKIG